MTVQIIISKDIENTSVEEMSEYLDETILEYLNAHGWIIDNISSI
jgi:hypothetical protein